MKKLMLIFIALVFSGLIAAQDIVTDRPDQSESPVLVGKKKFQIETQIELAKRFKYFNDSENIDKYLIRIRNMLFGLIKYLEDKS